MKYNISSPIKIKFLDFILLKIVFIMRSQLLQISLCCFSSKNSQKHRMESLLERNKKISVVNLRHRYEALQKQMKRKRCLLVKLDERSTFCLLTYLRLAQIVELYESVMKNDEMCRFIVSYLMISSRGYSKLEQEEFVEVLINSNIGKHQWGINHARGSMSNEKSRLNRCRQNIKYDVDRTYLVSNKILNSGYFPTRTSLSEKPSLATMQDFLNRILFNISKKYPQIGYVQGLNYIAKTMYLIGLSQEHAYQYLCYFLERQGFGRILVNGMIGLRELAYALKVYIFNYVPMVYKHFVLCDVDTEVFATSWFITLFSEDLPVFITDKIWHLFALQGWKTLIQFSIAVLCILQPEIVGKKNDEIFSYLRSIMKIFHEQSCFVQGIEKTIWKLMGSIEVSNEIVDFLCGKMEILEYDCQIQLWRVEAVKGNSHYRYKKSSSKQQRERSPARGRTCCQRAGMNDSMFPFCQNADGIC